MARVDGMPMNFVSLVREMQWTDGLDIIVVAVLVWKGLKGMSTPRARAAGLSLLFLLILFVVASQLRLGLTVWLLQGLAVLIVLIVVVVFQDEIRQLFRRTRQRGSRDDPDLGEDMADWLTATVVELASARTGALVVLPGSDPVDTLIVGGLRLDGLASRQLLLSIFDDSSPGHDGAVVLVGPRVARFGTHLPLSDDVAQLTDRGTRHAAALGLAERCDALVLVVSEETGRVSMARQGALTRLSDPAEVARIVGDHLHGVTPAGGQRATPSLLARIGIEAPLAIIIATVLWVGFVPGSVIDEVTHTVPVVIQNVPPDFALESFTPTTIAVTVAGPRRRLFLFEPGRLAFRVDATLVRLGRRQFALSPALLLLPPELSVVRMVPEQVTVTVQTP